MNAEVARAAETYARDEMGRRVSVIAVLDRGREAMALCKAKDGDEDFALVLTAATATHRWGVIDETDVEDFRRNDFVRDRCYACGYERRTECSCWDGTTRGARA